MQAKASPHTGTSIQPVHVPLHILLTGLVLTVRHKEAEIWSYVVSGQLSHKDSMGNIETMKRGDVQMTSGGTGISHSEFNDGKRYVLLGLQAGRRRVYTGYGM